MVTVAAVAVTVTGHGMGWGSAARTRAMAGPHWGSVAGEPAVTGRDREAVASSGMHSISQTSHAAATRRLTDSPGSIVAGGVIWTGNRTSPVYP